MTYQNKIYSQTANPKSLSTKILKSKSAVFGNLLLASLLAISFTTNARDVAVIDAQPKYETNAATLQAAAAYENKYSIFHPVKATKGMVVSEQGLATQVGLDVLEQGGNAIDAAVATGFALAVVLPNAGNLGGGGFMLTHIADDNKQYALDFRETAPSKAHKNLYLDDNGDVIPGKSLHTHQAVGVPGTVAGLLLAHEKWGTMPLNKLLAPAEKLARDGFIVSDDLAFKLNSNSKPMSQWPQTTAIFWQDGKPLSVGDLLVQQDLADSIKLIAEQGADVFYKGKIADQIVAEMQNNNGLITKDDLQNYKPVIRPVINGDYRGYTIATMPPPSSGGIHLVQMLNVLENWNLKDWGANSAQYMHHAAEAMRFAYADRSEYLGDADFVNVPTKQLTDKAYAKKLAAQIKPNEANKSKAVGPGLNIQEGTNTTHYSIIDKDGNAVATTYTLNTNFGTGIVADGTGILLNNEMDDFSAKPGVANVYGLIGNTANAIEPGKRPLSSMTPTIVLKDGKAWLITGSPGGSHIITTVLETIIDTIDFGMNPAQAAATPRFHHQWLPDEIRIEQGISPDTIRLLQSYGHKVQLKPTMGKTQTIMVADDYILGAADPRNPDSKAMGLN